MLCVISVVLQKRERNGDLSLKNILSWRVASSEDEARGSVVAYALDTCPGYSVFTVISNEIPQPLPEGE